MLVYVRDKNSQISIIKFYLVMRNTSFSGESNYVLLRLWFSSVTKWAPGDPNQSQQYNNVNVISVHFLKNFNDQPLTELTTTKLGIIRNIQHNWNSLKHTINPTYKNSIQFEQYIIDHILPRYFSSWDVIP